MTVTIGKISGEMVSRSLDRFKRVKLSNLWDILGCTPYGEEIDKKDTQHIENSSRFAIIREEHTQFGMSYLRTATGDEEEEATDSSE